MADLMVDFITSLDGFGAAEGWPGWWGLESPEYLAWLGEDSAADYLTLLGAKTYRMFAEFAASGSENLGDFVEAPKTVFSSTLRAPLALPNSTLVDGDAVAAVRTLKQGERPLRTIGSLSLCRALLEAGLVDRYRVVIFPVVTGASGQDRIYDGWPDVMLKPVSHRNFEGGLQMLEYAPTALDGPPRT